MIVVDAGAWAVSIVDRSPLGDAVRTVLTHQDAWVTSAHGPIEALRVLRRYERAGMITAGDADDSARRLRATAIETYGPESWLLDGIWAYRHNLSPYDAPYVVIAQALDTPLVTLDRRLANACRVVGVPVVVPAA